MGIDYFGPLGFRVTTDETSSSPEPELELLGHKFEFRV